MGTLHTHAGRGGNIPYITYKIYIYTGRGVSSYEVIEAVYLFVTVYDLNIFVLKLPSKCRKWCFRASKIKNFLQKMSVFIICDKAPLPFSIYFLLDFTAHTRSIFKIFTSMNLRNGLFLKPFNKLAVRVLSGIKHSAITSCF